MTTKTRLVEALTRDLEEQYKGSDKTAPYNAEGNLKSELSRLLKKEFDNTLDDSESMLLDAYKNAFEYYAKYRVDSEWELDVHTSSASESFYCDDIKEAKRLLSDLANPLNLKVEYKFSIVGNSVFKGSWKGFL